MIYALVNSRLVQFAALLAAFAALMAFGVIGIGRGDAPAFHDVRYFYIAGQMLREGLNPYDFELFKAAAAQYDPGGSIIGVYPYPPHSLAFCYVLSLFSLEAAKWMWTAASIMTLAAVAWVLRCWLLDRAASNDRHHVPAAMWIPVFAMGNPFSAHIIWIGQTGIFVLGFLVAAWLALSARRHLLAGAFLAAASMKPQLSLLIIAWFLFSWHWRVLVGAAISASVLLAPAVIVFGPAVVTDWLTSVSSYGGDLQQQLSYLANLASLLAATGVPALAALGQFSPIAGLALAAWLAYLSRTGRIDLNDAFATLIAASVWLVFGRDYDIAVLIPLLPMFFWHCRNDLARQLVAVSLLVLLCVPHRLVEMLDVPWLLYWRIMVVGTLLAWAIGVLYAQSNTSPAVRQATQ